MCKTDVLKHIKKKVSCNNKLKEEIATFLRYLERSKKYKKPEELSTKTK